MHDLKKGGGAGGSRASFWAYLGQFRGLFKEFGAKTGGRASPLDLDPRLSACVGPATDFTWASLAGRDWKLTSSHSGQA